MIFPLINLMNPIDPVKTNPVDPLNLQRSQWIPNDNPI